MPSLYVVLAGDIGLDSPDFCELQTDWFDQFVQQTGAPLWNFFGQDASEFLDQDELEGLDTGEKWFPAWEGLKAVQTLLAALQAEASPQAIRAREELQSLQSILEAADSAGVAFYLAVDI